MTGHAFQVLLEDDDVTDCLSNMRNHIASGGIIVFESRNPAVDWCSKWDYEITLRIKQQEVIERRRFLRMQDDRMTFELLYEFPDENMKSESTIRFLSHSDLTRLISECGLRIEKTLGAWDGSAFNPETSEEMIFFLQAASL